MLQLFRSNPKHYDRSQTLELQYLANESASSISHHTQNHFLIKKISKKKFLVQVKALA